MKLYGITGWKDAGKTTLVERLVEDITARGFRVSTVKHGHHTTDVDHEGRDSYRHREAGAIEVMLATPGRYALMHELRGAPLPPLPVLLAKMSPVDLVLIEGYKAEPHPKIEVYRQGAEKRPLARDNFTIKAIASDGPHGVEGMTTFDLNDIRSIADFILAEVGL